MYMDIYTCVLKLIYIPTEFIKGCFGIGLDSHNLLLKLKVNIGLKGLSLKIHVKFNGFFWYL